MTKMQRKKVAYVFSAAEEHWVGNGFFVSTIFSPSMLDSQLLSPFVLMDHAEALKLSRLPIRAKSSIGIPPEEADVLAQEVYNG